MLNPIAIILTLTALVGLIILIARRIPELREEESANAHPSWSKGNTWQSLKRFFSRIWEWLKEKVDDLRHALDTAKTDKKNTRDIAKHLTQAFKNRIEQRKQPAVAVTEAEADTDDLDKAEELYEQGQLAEAEELAIEVLKDNPTSKQAYELLGQIYTARKSYPEAAEVYRFLVKKSPSDDKYWAALGRVLAELENYQEAVKAYLRSLDLYANPEVFVSLGLAYQGVENYSAAGSAFESALDIDPENTQVLLLLAENFLHREDEEGAAHIFEQILEIDPSNNIARERLLQLK